ncbi:lipolytic protein G-D-S-L family [Solidesulfovibrio fructosivorans JJ]]|uniref:Lipolytic protein G-D-S-L family n=1 Tax=Solidesulfovibrio fructosivorans JJ] TaxID=596151 RepID=E1K172_SOLFR|nr:arylesterase [Solidesulfovibrio fructosivorans]EFL49632.1 lipolytic protein G-D-S-L family [Solidesulfovibrio fructosivorans JJ]]
MTSSATAADIRLAALGDSLTAGYGLPADDAFPAKLQAALKAKGHNVVIDNYGVSGDTTIGGLARLEGVMRTTPDGVILELGANDMLRGQDPEAAKANLNTILARLAKAGIPVLLCGMRSAKNYGADYAAAFDAVYPALAQKYDAVLYPFFLDGVTGHYGLTLADGLHPTAKGVDVIVERILPDVETFLKRVSVAKAAKAARADANP